MTPAVATFPLRARPAAVAPARGQPVARHAVGFFLFILLNAVLFLRPAEVVPALVGLNIYEYLILVCFAFSFPAVLEQFTAKSLESRPVTLCVLGLFLAVILSHLAQLDFVRLYDSGFYFAKVVVYYLLFVGLVDSPARLRTFLFWLLVFATATISLAVLQFHGYVTLPNLEQTLDHARDAETGQDVNFMRLAGSGIFHDPNDVGVLVAVAVLLALYWLLDRRSGAARVLWIGPLVLFLYALSLTQSRGALLALLAGLVVFLVARFGWRAAFGLGLLILPALLLLLAGRQTVLSTDEGTGQQRIQAWSDGLMLMREAPLFGVGKDVFNERIGMVAHNSYLQIFVELGVFGGLFFIGAFYLAVEQLIRLGDRAKHSLTDPEMARLYPYAFGLVAAWCMGMMSLTLCYILPTYTLLGLATVFVRTVPTNPPLPATRFDGRLLGRLLLVTVCGFAALYLFTRFFVVR